MIRCEPDKSRFCDPEATTNEYLIHTVELSDERSTSQFFTLWFKGKFGAIEEWRTAKGLDDHHNRAVYHRCGPWLPAQYPDKDSRGWSHHAHIDLQHAPTMADLQPYAEQIPPAILDEIKAYLTIWPTV
jgi:hypothetical protein